MHFNHGLSNKYKNLFKSAAISIVQNVLNKFIPKDLFQIDCAIVILKLNITLIISFLSLYHVPVKSCDQFI